MNKPGTLAPPAIEALQDGETFAHTIGVASGSTRPCIADIFNHGAGKGEGRQQHAHAVGIELHIQHGLPLTEVEAHLRDLNTRMAPPLRVSEIHKIIRRLEKPGSNWPYSCKHPLLADVCIGEECPFSKSTGAWKGAAVSPNGLTCSGWLPSLNGAEIKVFLGLYRLARLKGRGPKHSIPFTFAELQRHSGVDRHHHHHLLDQLQKHGLVSWTCSTERGKPSSFRFPPALPQPPLINRGGK